MVQIGVLFVKLLVLTSVVLVLLVSQLTMLLQLVNITLPTLLNMISSMQLIRICGSLVLQKFLLLLNSDLLLLLIGLMLKVFSKSVLLKLMLLFHLILKYFLVPLKLVSHVLLFINTLLVLQMILFLLVILSEKRDNVDFVLPLFHPLLIMFSLMNILHQLLLLERLVAFPSGLLIVQEL